jgi:hypothetical protein
MTDDPIPTVICSAKDCRRKANWVLVWNNPAVHTVDREKKWTACDDHKGSLSEFLALRSFLKRVEAMPPDPPRHEGPDRA